DRRGVGGHRCDTCETHLYTNVSEPCPSGAARRIRASFRGYRDCLDEPRRGRIGMRRRQSAGLRHMPGWETIFVAKHYKTLLINDIGWADGKLGAWRDTGANELALDVHSADALKNELASLAKASATFDAAVFSTHGNKGKIFLGD